jgi:hypothetical protein
VRKYRNRKVTTAHGNFDSVGEAHRYADLLLLVCAGDISRLDRQVKIPLTAGGEPVCFDNGRQAALVVDFSYIERGRLVYEDFKGFETHASKLKRAIARAMGIEVRLST